MAFSEVQVLAVMCSCQEPSNGFSFKTIPVFLAASSRLGSWAGRDVLGDVLLENLLEVQNLIPISAGHDQGNILHNLKCQK